MGGESKKSATFCGFFTGHSPRFRGRGNLRVKDNFIYPNPRTFFFFRITSEFVVEQV